MLIKDLQSIPEYGTIRMIKLFENGIFRALEHVRFFVFAICKELAVSQILNTKH